MQISTVHSPVTGKMVLLYGDRSLTRLALVGVTRLAADARAIWVLDGANSFDAYFVARLARGWGYVPQPVLARIRLSRAFTCYQMSELVERKLRSAIDRSPAAVVLCLGLLETFYDEDVRLNEAVRLLRRAIASLADLAQRGHTIVITASEPPAGERSVLFNLTKASANAVRHLSVPDRRTQWADPLPLLDERREHGAHVAVIQSTDHQ